MCVYVFNSGVFCVEGVTGWHLVCNENNDGNDSGTFSFHREMGWSSSECWQEHQEGRQRSVVNKRTQEETAAPASKTHSQILSCDVWPLSPFSCLTSCLPFSLLVHIQGQNLRLAASSRCQNYNITTRMHCTFLILTNYFINHSFVGYEVIRFVSLTHSLWWC